MKKNLKICILDCVRFKTSGILPFRYRPGVLLSSEVTKVCPPNLKDPQFFVCASDTPVQKLVLDDFQVIPPSCSFHVLVVTGASSIENKTSLFSRIDAQAPSEISSEVKRFLSSDQSQHLFETPYHVVRVERIAFDGKRAINIDARVIACDSVNGNGLSIVYHDHRTIKELNLLLFPPEQVFSSPAAERKQVVHQDIPLLQDIAAFEEPFNPDRIFNAVKTEAGLHLEIETASGKRQIKTFIQKEKATTNECAAYFDTGNRVLHMSVVEEVPDVALLLAVERKKRSFKTFSWIRGIVEKLTGNLCDVAHESSNGFYLLTWDPATLSSYIYHQRLGIDIEETGTKFSCLEQPLAFIWFNEISSFLLAFPSGIYLYCAHEGERELVEITSCFGEGYERKLPGESIHSMDLCYVNHLPFLIINRVNKIEIFMLDLSQDEATEMKEQPTSTQGDHRTDSGFTFS